MVVVVVVAAATTTERPVVVSDTDTRKAASRGGGIRFVKAAERVTFEGCEDSPGDARILINYPPTQQCGVENGIRLTNPLIRLELRLFRANCMYRGTWSR